MSGAMDRYAHSVSSGNLRSGGAGPADIDALIAAGWVRDGLAVRLFRTRFEFDAIRAQLRANYANAPHGASGDAERDALSERAYIFSHITGLTAASCALLSFVQKRARAKRLEVGDEYVRNLCGRVLDSFLDSTCEVCQGTCERLVPGSNRLSGAQCPTCQGTGARRFRFAGGMSNKEYEFVTGILSDLERKMNRVSFLMYRFMRTERNRR